MGQLSHSLRDVRCSYGHRSGLRARPAVRRPAACVPVPGPPDREDLRDLFETIAAPVRAGEAVIVVIGDWLPAETLGRVRTVHSLLETDRVAIHVTHLPPLAASVLAALTAALAPMAKSAGALAGALEAIGDQLVVLAWAGTVAGLRHSDVSLLDHARSALPWSSFGIGVQPDSFVQPLTRSAGEVPLTRPPHPVDLLIAPGDQAELEWITQEVAPALGVVTIRELPHAARDAVVGHLASGGGCGHPNQPAVVG